MKFLKSVRMKPEVIMRQYLRIIRNMNRMTEIGLEMWKQIYREIVDGKRTSWKIP